MATIQPPILNHCGPGHGSRSNLGMPSIRSIHGSQGSKFIGEPNHQGFKNVFINRATNKTTLMKESSNRYLMEEYKKRNSTQVASDLRHQLNNAKAKLNANYDYNKGKINNRYNSPLEQYGTNYNDITRQNPVSKSVMPSAHNSRRLTGNQASEADPSENLDTIFSSKLTGFKNEDGYTLF